MDIPHTFRILRIHRQPPLRPRLTLIIGIDMIPIGIIDHLKSSNNHQPYPAYGYPNYAPTAYNPWYPPPPPPPIPTSRNHYASNSYYPRQAAPEASLTMRSGHNSYQTPLTSKRFGHQSELLSKFKWLPREGSTIQQREP